MRPEVGSSNLAVIKFQYYFPANLSFFAPVFSFKGQNIKWELYEFVLMVLSKVPFLYISISKENSTNMIFTMFFEISKMPYINQRFNEISPLVYNSVIIPLPTIHQRNFTVNLLGNKSAGATEAFALI